MTIEAENSNDEDMITFIKMKDYEGLRNAILVGLEINKQYNEGWTLLHYAAELNGLELMEIISSHPQVNFDARTSFSMCTPLIIASQSGNSVSLKFLLDKGADATCVDSNGLSALMVASKENHLECVKLLIETDINLAKLQDKNGMNALMHGIDNAEIVEKLINHSDLTQVNSQKHTVLHLASKSNLDSVRIIVERNVIDINLKCPIDGTPLQVSAEVKKLDIAGYLIENGAIFSFSHNLHVRLYFLAIQIDETETFLIKYLMDAPLLSGYLESMVSFNRSKILKAYAKKISDDQFESFFERAISLVCENGNLRADCFKILLEFAHDTKTLKNCANYAVFDLEYFKLFFEHILKVSTKKQLNEHLRYVFLLSIRSYKAKVCRYLLEWGIDPIIYEGQTFLEWFICLDERNIDVFKLLIKYRIDLENGVFIAVCKNNLKLVRCLLKNGANFNLAFKNRLFPIHKAIISNWTDMFFELLPHCDVLTNNRSEFTGRTMVLDACNNQNLGIIKALVEMGACLDDIDKQNHNCLHLALLTTSKEQRLNSNNIGNYLEVFLFLAEQLADKFISMITAKNIKGLSPADLINQIDNRDFSRGLLLAKPELEKYIRVPLIIKIEDQEMCLICRDIFNENDHVKKLPCGHLYHKHCLEQLSDQFNGICPYCRKRVKTD